MKNADIFVQARIPLADVARRVGDALGIELKDESTEEERGFVYEIPGERVGVFDNEYEGDSDMPLGGYALSAEVKLRDDQQRIARARKIFDALKPLGTRLLLVDDLQTKLDEFEPASSHAAE